MRLRIVALAAVLAAACSSGTAPDAGPVKVGVISGNHQVVTAARQAPRLPKDVTIQAAYQANGSIALRVLDAVLPPKAYAQTAVHGAPGVVVCAVSPDPKHALVPEVPCTTTDVSGLAYFTFHSDSIAGVSEAQARSTINGQTVVSDSVLATILPAAADPNFVSNTIPIAAFPATVPATSVVDQYGNAVPFRIVGDSNIVVQDSVVGSVGARTITRATGDLTYRYVELRGANNVLVARARYKADPTSLQVWVASGVNRQP